MKLDRNISPGGKGKYALLKLRELEGVREQGPFGEIAPSIVAALKLLEDNGILDWGSTPETEFFVIRLKDKYARGALLAYAGHAARDDAEYGNEVLEMAGRAGNQSPWCKRPD